MTAVYEYIINSGTIIADTADVLTDVQGEWLSSLGSTLDLDASTPQGTLIANETIARTAVMKNNADMANLLNPQQAYGVFLDSISALTGVTRGSNSYTIVNNVTFTGNEGTTINANSRVRTENGDIFIVQSTIQIPAALTINGVLQSESFGSIPIPLGDLEIIDGTSGWGSCVLTTSSIVNPGTVALLDPQFKNSRIQRLAALGVGSSAAVVSEVAGVPGVTSVMVVENNTGAVGTVNGVTFTLPNALWVCLAGNATSAAIAAALYKAHNGGCPWDFGAAGMGTPVNPPNGVATLDPKTGLAYNVKWVTPIMFDCYVNITVVPAPGVATPIQTVQEAIFDYASGQEEGEPGLVIGANVSAFEMAGAVARNIPGMYVRNCAVAVVPAGAAAPVYPGGYSTEVLIGRFEQADLQIGNITVQQST